MSFETGYVGLTDPDWYSFLQSRSKVDEVNFWQPHGDRAFRAINRGDLFFFKLRAPFKSLVGFGFFQRYESLPAWLAWDCFGEMNGAQTYEEMIERICSLRGEKSSEQLAGDFRIGCIMISAPVFFKPDEQIAPPTDWAKSGIQQGKRYDLRAGEGMRIMTECFARAQSGSRYWNIERGIAAEESPRYGNPTTITPRLGQGLFSLEVRDAYHGACAITNEHSSPVLEAAHIVPYARGGLHRVDNGILLRRDLHRLFDLGYVTVSSDYRFRVGSRLRQEFNNGRLYYELNGQSIHLPGQTQLQPNKEYLEWHEQTLFKG
ncbi:MAG TPA: HNH endonuclease [Kiritimatiellia bacterium]|nr:HNH endonuclease [Saprospiraceae bacterium]HMP00484.1 HNH endonuclease [Kiritimatiellia bacterium]